MHMGNKAMGIAFADVPDEESSKES